MTTVIPGLPLELELVPDAPSGPDDPLRDQKRAAFLDWRLALWRYRITRQHEIRNDPRLHELELAYCAIHPAYFSSIWMTVYEPRQRRGGSGALPFIPFAKQVDVLDAFLEALKAEDESADIVWSKCRGWGATWLGALFGMWGWLFSHRWSEPLPWNVLYLSRKQEYVDSRMQRSIFWKLRSMLHDLPDFMIPAGFDFEEHVMKGIITNPANRNELAGESTNTEAGRGDRVTWAWVDEAAAMDEFGSIWSTLADTTDHRFGASTEGTDHGPDWWNLRSGLDMDHHPRLVESDWWENPLNDDAWFEKQKRRFENDPDAFNREILRNPFSGQTTWVYPKAWDIEADPTVKPIVGRPAFVTIDPGYTDDTVLVAAQENDSGGVDILDAYANARVPADFYAPLLKPSLFAADDPSWMTREHIQWTTPPTAGIEPQTFEYDEAAIAFAATVDAMGKPTYVGDTYGDNVTGATADSVYSRWQRHGIYVNRDRRGEKDLSAYTKIARTGKGRRESLSERLGRWRFAQNPGGERTLKAVRTHRFKPKSERPVMTEAKMPLHDWTSHYCSALEFLAVHLKQRGAIVAREYAKPVGMARNNLRGSAWRNVNKRGSTWTP